MELNGREVKFMYNILASIEIAKLCPDGRLENIEKLFGEETYETDISNTNKFMIALNRGYIAAKKAVEPDYDVKELSEDELMLISNAEYLELQNEAFKAYKEGNERHVHTAPVKSKGKKNGNSGQKIELNDSWLLFYGHMMNMTRQEIMITRYGEFRDLISCFAVHEGSARLVEKKRKWTFDEAIALR